MAIKVRPLHDRIIVQRLEEEEEQQVGGIIIPDTAKEKPQQGKVVAVGKGKIKDDGGLGADGRRRTATPSCSASTRDRRSSSTAKSI